MLGDGPRCQVLGDELFSAYWSDASTWNILDIFSDNNKKILKTEKPQQQNQKTTTTPKPQKTKTKNNNPQMFR